MKSSKNGKNNYFSMGVFLTAIFNAMPSKNSYGEKITEPITVKCLMEILDDGFENMCGNKNAFKVVVSSYKNCKDNGQSYFPTLNSIKTNTFNKDYENNSKLLKNKAIKFVENCIDIDLNVRKLFLASIRCLVENDNYDNRLQGLLNLLENKKLDIYDTILSSLYYIINNRNDNKFGKDYVDSILKTIDNKKKLNIKIPEEYIDAIKKSQVEKKDIDLIENEINNTYKNEYKEYFDNLIDRYKNIKTLIYEQPISFEKIYVNNNLTYYENGKIEIIENPTIGKISNISNFAIISGVGGMGKSMLIKHLLFDNINMYDRYEKIPIFIQAKDYDNNTKSLYDFIKENVSIYSDKVTKNLDEILNNGNATILLDGFDEINNDIKLKFEKDIEQFINKYSSNQFIITSRPFDNFSYFDRFTVFHVEPFDLDKAIVLINKLDFRNDDSKIKNEFVNKLKTSFWYSHSDFIKNPLLLTILLLTYEQYGEVPSKMHQFYNKAYSVLTREHDATKSGYNRQFSTKLDADSFKEIFAEFCIKSYVDTKYSFKEADIEEYFYKISDIKNKIIDIKLKDFVRDITSTTNLMYFENGEYSFLHRTFQEYFSMYFISKQKDKFLLPLVMKINDKKSVVQNTNALNMLYDMIPDRFDEYIILPYLSDLFTKYNTDNFKDFLINIYPTINCSIGYVDISYNTIPIEILYHFIIKKFKLNIEIKNDSLPEDSVFVTNRYYLIEKDENTSEIVEMDDNDISDLPSEYFNDYGYPEEEGCNMSIDTKEAFDECGHDKLCEKLLSDDFSLRKEYNNVKEYYESLKTKTSKKGKDVFDML